jgi:hypothetical protein
MAELLQFAQGQRWTVNFEDSKVALMGIGLTFSRKTPEEEKTPPQPGEWVLIPSAGNQYALAWFVCVKCDDAGQYVLAMTPAQEVLATVTNNNITSIHNVIAVRHSKICIRLSGPPPYPEAAIAVKKVEESDLADHFMHNPSLPLIKPTPTPGKVTTAVEKIKAEMRRRKLAKLAAGGLYRLVPTGIFKKIALKAGLKASAL